MIDPIVIKFSAAGIPEVRAAFEQVAAQTRRALTRLHPREEAVLKLRFGIGHEEGLTLEQVGEMFNLTRERIRQIETGAIKKLQTPAHRDMLEVLVES